MTIDLSQAYHLLGLSPGAPPDAVKAAYRDLAQVWHPDRFETNERLRDKAAQNLQRINEAYEVLGGHQVLPEEAVAVPQMAPLTLGERISAAFGIRDLGHLPLLDRLEVLWPSPTYSRRHRRRQRPRAWLVVGMVLVVLFTAMLAALATWIW